jgi:ATP phosphoribosyltransferase regulatory subunit
LQLGAELFGHAGVESDIEIQALMVRALQQMGVQSLHVDFNHVGIFANLVSQGQIAVPLEQSLYAALQSKDRKAVLDLTESLVPDIREALISLIDLNGNISVLDKAEKLLPPTQKIGQALDDLRRVGQLMAGLGVEVCYDLAELRGYHYHSGMVFAAYAKGYAGPLALGGRYDEVGSAFGRARPATGFSLDLRGIVSAMQPAEPEKAIFAPYGNEAGLLAKINSLRDAGEVVVQELPGHEPHRSELNCDRKLVKQGDVWQVVAAPELSN